ncbi:Uncharacterised protein [Bordetella avium]|nr:Uncharacterised protein [Bordetella avium]
MLCLAPWAIYFLALSVRPGLERRSLCGMSHLASVLVAADGDDAESRKRYGEALRRVWAACAQHSPPLDAFLLTPHSPLLFIRNFFAHPLRGGMAEIIYLRC